VRTGASEDLPGAKVGCLSILLQASGKANARCTLLKDEMNRGPDFLRLANALSALYPQGCEEKRLLDAMVLAAPR